MNTASAKTIPTPYGPVRVGPFTPVINADMKVRTYYLDAFAPRYYASHLTVMYYEMIEDTYELSLKVREMCVVESLKGRVETDWRAEVPDEPYEFACGAGISNGASMFYKGSDFFA